MTPPFCKEAGRVLNSGTSRSLLLHGNIHDLFPLDRSASGGELDYVPLVDFLSATWDVASKILVVYELNGPVRFLRDGDRQELKEAWTVWRSGLSVEEAALRTVLASTRKARAELRQVGEDFDEALERAIGKPTLAFELLRQMCHCSRLEGGGEPLLARDLLILIEGADLALPDAPIQQLDERDRHRVAICQDWFLDPGFQRGGDSVVLLCESRSLINQRVARLPQVLGVEVPSPDEPARQAFVEWFLARPEVRGRLELWGSPADLARASAGLSLHALWQLLKSASHEDGRLEPHGVVDKVEEHIQRELGEEVVEFSRPRHRIADLVGFRNLKQFLRDELLPRFKVQGPAALPGAAVCGPIGGGKTFIFEAVAAELDMPVMVLKSIRSQWFGQTDVILERLRRVLETFSKVLIFVDEADTQFGGVGAEAHATERRLTGKIQAMMSDPRLRGRVLWLLMTARVHRLSPDIRRPGRVGDLIIPVLDPEGEDLEDFLRWVVKPVWQGDPAPEDLDVLREATRGYFSASFASLRSELQAEKARRQGPLNREDVLQALHDRLAPPISETRRYQILQAMVNCTRRSLLPAGEQDAGDERRAAWVRELEELERRGVG